MAITQVWTMTLRSKPLRQPAQLHELCQSTIKAAEECEFGQNTTKTVENEDEKQCQGILEHLKDYCDYISIKIRMKLQLFVD